jgi:diguanylate cyclase (GGDEF)-like protein
MEGGSASTLLPVPVSAYGPLNEFAVRIHQLMDNQRSQEALALADSCEAAARGFGDEKTLSFVLQGRMYCYEQLGQYDVASVIGEALLARHRAAGNVPDEAKTLSDLAAISVRRGLIVDAMSYLARAGLLLETTTRRNDRYVSALSSYALAALVADLYEIAAAGYDQLEAHMTPAIGRAVVNVFLGEIQVHLLTAWGLRLDQLGYGSEATSRLRRAAALAEDWLEAATDPDKKREVLALRALSLAKIGDIDEAVALAEPVIAAPPAQGLTSATWAAHLALGVAYRARGNLTAAHREFLTARWLAESGSRLGADFRPIVQHELAMLDAQAIGPEVCGDLVEDIRLQAERLWQQRLQRKAMLRQARRHEELEMERAHTEEALLFDRATGLGNRRRFDQLMNAVDGGYLPTPTSMILVDVDKFTAINDAHSPGAGDYVLRELGTILTANCRPADPLPIRYAGDRFVIFLHGDLPTAVAIAKRMRAAVAAADFDQVIPGTPVTVSVGVAMLRRGMTAAELYRTADTNLRQAKRDGRDRVVG